MNISFKTITTFLLIILVGILVGIFIMYYNTPIRVSTNNTEINNNSSHQDTPEIITNTKSGDFASNIEPQSDVNKATIISDSGEINSKVDVKNNEDSNKIDNNSNNGNKPLNNKNEGDKNNQVIITSEDTMTNKEKREILTELDDTLMELLDVVDKVQTVDETRLITDESEVQK